MSSKHTAVTVSSSEAQSAAERASAQDQQQQQPSTPAASPEAAAAAEALRQQKAGPTPLRYDASTGQVAPAGSQRMSLSGASFNQGEGILATARTKHGGPIRGDLKADDRVTGPGGLEMTIEGAIGAGLIRKNQHGQYEEVAEAAPQGGARDEGSDGEMKEELFHPELEGIIAKLAGDIPGKVLVSALAQYVRKAAESGEQPNPNKFASDTGMTQEQARHFLGVTLAAFEAQATHTLQEMGMSAAGIERFQVWAGTNRPEAFKAALVNHVNARSLHGYRALAREYFKQVPPSAEVLQRAGYKTMEDPNSGEDLVYLDGMWQSIRAAARNGRL